MDKLEEAKLLASKIHNKVCHWNHADGCGWYYFKFDDFSYPTKKGYLDKANSILEEVSLDVALKVISRI